MEQRVGYRGGDSKMAQSLAEVGMNSPVDLFATYAGRASDLKEWLSGAAINRDRNLRMQYLAGIGLNLTTARPSTAACLPTAIFPRIFSPVPKVESIRYGRPSAASDECPHVSGQPSWHASAYNAAGSRSRISPLLPRKMIRKSAIVGGALRERSCAAGQRASDSGRPPQTRARIRA